MKLLKFHAYGNNLAIDVDNIDRVEFAYAYEKLSEPKEGVIGLIRMGDQIIQLIDAAYPFGNFFCEPDKHNKYLILRHQEKHLALLVHDVDEVIDLKMSYLKLLHKSEITERKTKVFFHHFFVEASGVPYLVLNAEELFSSFWVEYSETGID